MAKIEVARFKYDNTLEAVRNYEATKDARMIVMPGGQIVPPGLQFTFDGRIKPYQVDQRIRTLPTRSTEMIYLPRVLPASHTATHNRLEGYGPCYQDIMDQYLPGLTYLGLRWELARAAEVIRILLEDQKRPEAKPFRGTQVFEDRHPDDFYTMTVDEVQKGPDWDYYPKMVEIENPKYDPHQGYNFEPKKIWVREDTLHYYQNDWPKRIRVGDKRVIRHSWDKQPIDLMVTEEPDTSYYVGVFAIGVPIQAPVLEKLNPIWRFLYYLSGW